MNKSLLRCFCILIWVLCLLSFPATARVYIDITAPYLQQIPIAVPYLDPVPDAGGDNLLGSKIARILSDDLSFHGFFSVLDPAQYGGRSDADWSPFRLDYLVKGSFSLSGDSLTTEFRLFDLSSNTMLEGRRYRGKMADHRKMAHRFCDLIVRRITGEPGVSLSKTTFVAARGQTKEVYIADFDGENIRRVTFDESVAVSPTLSPDGRYLAYTSYRTGRPFLYIKDLKTNTLHKLTSYAGLNISPAWHPGGGMLAVTLSKDGNPDIYLVDLKGRIKSRLTEGPGINVSPTWSPNGGRLAFVSDRGGTPQIYVMNVKTGEVRRITYRGSYNTDPAWSPRGDRIVYSGREDDGTYQIFTISPKGGEPVQLTFSGDNENPSWSPDGRQILFTSSRLGPAKALFVMHANGKAQRKLVEYGDGISTPNWGPNSL